MQRPTLLHYCQTPKGIVHSKLTARAIHVYSHLALYASVRKPDVWLRQAHAAKELNRSTDYVYRGLKELLAKGIIVEAGRWHLGRYKYYTLLPLVKSEEKKEAEPETNSESGTSRKSAERGTADLPDVVPQICGDINRTLPEHKSEQFFNGPAQHSKVEGKEIDSKFLEKMKKDFPCLDGKSGRPTIEECIENGLAHESRKKFNNLGIFLRWWLRNATKNWRASYKYEQTGGTGNPELSPEEQERARAERKAKVEKEQKARDALDAEAKRMRNQKVAMPEFAAETPEQAAKIAAKLKASMFNDWRKERASRTLSREELNAQKEGREVLPLFISMNPEELKREYPIQWEFLRAQYQDSMLKAA